MFASAPLLFYALAFFLGISAKLAFHPLYLLFFLLWRKKIVSSLALFLLGFSFATYTCTLPKIPEEGSQGSGIFTVSALIRTSSPFGSAIMTQGLLETFSTSTTTWKKIPCMIYTPLDKPRPIGTRFAIEGNLLPKTYPHYVLKPSSITPLSPPSLPEWRFRLKLWSRAHFESLFPDPAVSSFLLSMVTGEVDDRLMAMQFNRLGLLHLLGISGFQFSLLAFLLGALLKPLLPRNTAIYVLALLLSIYAFLLGNSPPIQRAYMTLLLYLAAERFNLQITPLNALGGALLWVLLLDPLSIFHLGFQFSFLCTAAIVILYPLMRPNPRRFAHLYKLPLLEKIGNFFLFLGKEALALNGAIHLITAPLLFYHFHKIPFLSLAYNLFLPATISIAYLFLIPGLSLALFSHLLAAPFLKVAHLLTAETLLIANSPLTPLDFQIHCAHLSFGGAICCIGIVLGLFFKVMLRRENGLSTQKSSLSVR